MQKSDTFKILQSITPANIEKSHPEDRSNVKLVSDLKTDDIRLYNIYNNNNTFKFDSLLMAFTTDVKYYGVSIDSVLKKCVSLCSVLKDGVSVYSVLKDEVSLYPAWKNVLSLDSALKNRSSLDFVLKSGFSLYAALKNGVSIDVVLKDFLSLDSVLKDNVLLDSVLKDVVSLVSVLKDGASLDSVLENIVSLNYVLQDGVSLDSLLQDGVSLDSLLQDGVSLDSLLQDGVSLDSLLKNGVSLDSVLQDVVSLVSVLKDGASLDSVLKDVVSLGSVLKDGASLDSVLKDVVLLGSVLKDGASLDSVLKDVVSLVSVLQDDVSLDSVLKDVVSLVSVLKDGASLDSVLENIVSLNYVLQDGVSLDSLLKDGVSLDSLLKNGVSLDSLLKDCALLDSLLKDDVSLDSLLKDDVSFDSILKNSSTNTHSMGEFLYSSLLSPFIPRDDDHNECINSYYLKRIGFHYKKNHEKNEMIVSNLFFVNSFPYLEITFAVILLHHSGIFSLFDKDHLKQTEQFKPFLDFVTCAPEKSGQIQDLESSILDLARSLKIEKDGLFCIKNMSNVHREFFEFFDKFIHALQVLSAYTGEQIHKDDVDFIAYSDAFDELVASYKKHYTYCYSDVKCLCEPENAMLFLLMRAVNSINRCVQEITKKDKAPSTHISAPEHHCVCMQKTNHIVDLGLLSISQ